MKLPVWVTESCTAMMFNYFVINNVEGKTNTLQLFG